MQKSDSHHAQTPKSCVASQRSDSEGGTLLSWGAPGVPALIRYTVAGDPEITMLAIDWRAGEYYLDPGKFPAGRITFEILLADQDV